MLLTDSLAGQQPSKSPPPELDAGTMVGTDVSSPIVNTALADSNDTKAAQGSLGSADALDAPPLTRRDHGNDNNDAISAPESQLLNDAEYRHPHVRSSSISASDSHPVDTITQSIASVPSIIPLTTGPLSAEETRQWQVYGVLTERVLGNRIRIAEKRRAARRAQDDLKLRIMPLIESIGDRDTMDLWTQFAEAASHLAHEEDVLATNEAQLLRFIPHKVNLRDNAQFDDLPRDEIDFIGSEIDYDEELDDLARTILLNNEKESALEDQLLRLNHKFDNLFDVAIDPSTADADRDKAYADLDELDLTRKQIVQQLDETRANRELVQETVTPQSLYLPLDTNLTHDPVLEASSILVHSPHYTELPLPPSPTISVSPQSISPPFSPNDIPLPTWPVPALDA
jgi:hypothetical protein